MLVEGVRATVEAIRDEVVDLDPYRLWRGRGCCAREPEQAERRGKRGDENDVPNVPPPL